MGVTIVWPRESLSVRLCLYVLRLVYSVYVHTLCDENNLRNFNYCMAEKGGQQKTFMLADTLLVSNSTVQRLR